MKSPLLYLTDSVLTVISLIKIGLITTSLQITLPTESQALASQESWWMTEPIRLVQTNIPIQMWEHLTAEELINGIEEINGNTWLFNVGGIYANYPTELSFQAKNPYLEDRGDLMQEIYDLAEERGIRLLARFDFSRFDRAVADAHPEWAFKRKNGEMIEYNGLITSCINSDYYRSASLEMIQEFLEKYPAEAVFVNWWGNHPINGYSGIENGVCYCQACQEKWAAFSKNPFPKRWNSEYRKFMTRSSLDTAELVRDAIKASAPDAAFILYGTKRNMVTDGFTAESKTNYTPNIWWPYQSSYLVNLARSSYPDQMVFNTVVNFIKMPFRFEPHRGGVNQNRMLQGMAHGGFPGLYMVGPFIDEKNKHAAESMRFPLKWHQEHEEYFPGQVSNAAIALIGDGFSTEELRGIFCLLSEAHLPFCLFERTQNFPGGPQWDLVISAPTRSGRVRNLDPGTSHLIIGSNKPPQFDGSVGKLWSIEETFAGYWKVEDDQFFPDLIKRTELIGIESEYLEIEELGSFEPRLMMVPPAYHSTTEITHINRKDSTKPGLVLKTSESGSKTMWLPWQPGTTYHLRGNDSLREMFSDIFDHMLGGKRQIVTDAHPLIEISYMKQPEKSRLLIHLINLTNQLHGSGGQLLPAGEMNFSVLGEFDSAYLAEGKTPLAIDFSEGYTRFTVPKLNQYDIVVLEKPTNK
ncbi:MAG: beta-galactosidase [Verrucomicrobiota bacterium]